MGVVLTTSEDVGITADGSGSTAAPPVPVDEVADFVTWFYGVISKAQTPEMVQPSWFT